MPEKLILHAVKYPEEIFLNQGAIEKAWPSGSALEEHGVCDVVTTLTNREDLMQAVRVQGAWET